jgi:hypothetical protein
VTWRKPRQGERQGVSDPTSPAETGSQSNQPQVPERVDEQSRPPGTLDRRDSSRSSPRNTVGPQDTEELMLELAQTIRAWSRRHGYSDLPPYFVLQQVMVMLDAHLQAPQRE